jgi:glycosyltransferase involved in cell wall biosynthesis
MTKFTNNDLIILSDPWLLGLTRYHKNTVLIFHDNRNSTKYRDDVFSSILFRFFLKELRLAKFVIAVSEFSERILLELGIPQERIFLLYNSSELISDTSLKQIQPHQLKKIFSVYYVASNQRHKNINFYLSIAKSFLDSAWANNIHFYLLTNNLKSMCCPDLNNVTIVTKNIDLNEFYMKMDCLVFPSLYEGFGLPLIEAMSYGIPIIASDIPTNNEIIGDSGLIVGDFETLTWKRAIESLLNPTNYDKYSALSYNRSKMFSYDNFKKRLNSIIGKMLQEGHSFE